MSKRPRATFHALPALLLLATVLVPASQAIGADAEAVVSGLPPAPVSLPECSDPDLQDALAQCVLWLYHSLTECPCEPPELLPACLEQPLLFIPGECAQWLCCQDPLWPVVVAYVLALLDHAAQTAEDLLLWEPELVDFLARTLLNANDDAIAQARWADCRLFRADCGPQPATSPLEDPPMPTLRPVPEPPLP